MFGKVLVSVIQGKLDYSKGFTNIKIIENVTLTATKFAGIATIFFYVFILLFYMKTMY